MVGLRGIGKVACGVEKVDGGALGSGVKVLVAGLVSPLEHNARRAELGIWLHVAPILFLCVGLISIFVLVVPVVRPGSGAVLLWRWCWVCRDEDVVFWWLWRAFGGWLDGCWKVFVGVVERVSFPGGGEVVEERLKEL